MIVNNGTQKDRSAHHNINLLLYFIQHFFTGDCHTFQDMMCCVEHWLCSAYEIDMSKSTCIKYCISSAGILLVCYVVTLAQVAFDLNIIFVDSDHLARH